ncbi:carbohydrate sulfotransferase 1-like [Pecten maximus]|uniref:carbohydrate sulfotransferase 1-like n=1 Tax=Pecten maximus TaxID=6579 RepID=UPI0014580DF8|nr:carbohydrate sulfotransferase 1-like [Pecten maximus]
MYEIAIGQSDNVGFDVIPDKISSQNKTYDVLLIAYLRGGTTFLGEMLGFRNENFYIYEPLHNLTTFGYFKPGFLCSMMDESCRRNNQTDDQVLDVIRGIYNCDSRKYRHLLQSWHYIKSMGQQKFSACSKTRNGCPEKYFNQCSTAVSKVSKIPRISIGLASKLLTEFPNLKIIHLLRDPRAIMNSRYRLKWTPVPGGALSLCKKMKSDYQESIQVKKTHPGRLYTVFYEALAQNNLETFKDIYNFIGYQFDKEDHLRLTKMTASTKDGPVDDTRRHDSAKTARKWRYQINTNVLIETNKACSELYRLLGYPQLKSIHELKNESIPLNNPTFQENTNENVLIFYVCK